MSRQTLYVPHFCHDEGVMLSVLWNRHVTCWINCLPCTSCTPGSSDRWRFSMKSVVVSIVLHVTPFTRCYSPLYVCWSLHLCQAPRASFGFRWRQTRRVICFSPPPPIYPPPPFLFLFLGIAEREIFGIEPCRESVLVPFPLCTSRWCHYIFMTWVRLWHQMMSLYPYDVGKTMSSDDVILSLRRGWDYDIRWCHSILMTWVRLWHQMMSLHPYDVGETMTSDAVIISLWRGWYYDIRWCHYILMTSVRLWHRMMSFYPYNMGETMTSDLCSGAGAEPSVVRQGLSGGRPGMQNHTTQLFLTCFTHVFMWSKALLMITVILE